MAALGHVVAAFGHVMAALGHVVAGLGQFILRHEARFCDNSLLCRRPVADQ